MKHYRSFRFDIDLGYFAEYWRGSWRCFAALNKVLAHGRRAMPAARATARYGAILWVSGVGLTVVLAQSVRAETLSLDCKYDTPEAAEEFKTFHVDISDTSATVTAAREIHKIYENKKTYPHDMYFRKTEFEINYGDINAETEIGLETTINRRTRQFTETIQVNLIKGPVKTKIYSGSCEQAEGPKL